MIKVLIFAAAAFSGLLMLSTPASAASTSGFGNGTSRPAACNNARQDARLDLAEGYGEDVSYYGQCTCEEVAPDLFECEAAAYGVARQAYVPPPRPAYRAPVYTPPAPGTYTGTIYTPGVN